MQTIVIALAWLAQILGFGAAATALNDPTILQDHGKLVVAVLATALALAGALPSIIGGVRSWWIRVRDAATGGGQGGHALASLLTALAVVSMAVLLTACSVITNPPQAVNPAAATSPRMAAQATINAGLVAIISLGETINADESAGLLPRAEADESRQKLRAHKRDLDTAHDVLVSGDVAGAQTRAELIAKAITALRLQIAQKARAPQ